MAIQIPNRLVGISKQTKATNLRGNNLPRSIKFTLSVQRDEGLQCQPVVPRVDIHGVLSFDLPVGQCSQSFKLDAVIFLPQPSSTIPAVQRKTIMQSTWLTTDPDKWTFIESYQGYEFRDVPLARTSPQQLRSKEAGGVELLAEVTAKQNLMQPGDITLRLDLSYSLLALLLRSPSPASASPSVSSSSSSLSVSVMSGVQQCEPITTQPSVIHPNPVNSHISHH